MARDIQNIRGSNGDKRFVHNETDAIVRWQIPATHGLCKLNAICPIERRSKLEEDKLGNRDVDIGSETSERARRQISRPGMEAYELLRMTRSGAGKKNIEVVKGTG